MTLATHGVVGAAMGAALGPVSPTLGLLAAFGSHFLLDALPHWDYSLRSKKVDLADELNSDLALGRDFLVDLAKIGFDFTLGLALAGFLIGSASGLYAWALAGALLGQAPDFFQFLYFKLRWGPLRQLQRFHLWIHTKHKIKRQWLLGIISQLLIILLTVVLWYN